MHDFSLHAWKTIYPSLPEFLGSAAQWSHTWKISSFNRSNYFTFKFSFIHVKFSIQKKSMGESNKILNFNTICLCLFESFDVKPKLFCYKMRFTKHCFCFSRNSLKLKIRNELNALLCYVYVHFFTKSLCNRYILACTKTM